MQSLRSELAGVKQNLRLISLLAAIMVGGGAAFYHIVEKLNWLDSVYLSVITLATVGYGDITPKTDLGKAFTIFYILLGIGILATFANLMIKRATLKQSIRRTKR